MIKHSSFSAAAMIAAGLGCALTLVVRAQDRPTSQPMSTTQPITLTAAQLATMPPPMSVYGRVLDPAGKPVAGATVQAASYSYTATEYRETVTPLTTDAQGRFQTTSLGGNLQLLVQAAGYAMTPARISGVTTEADPFEIHLRAGSDLSVRFVGPGGEPAAGVKVILQMIRDSSSTTPFAGNAFVSIPTPLANLLAQTTDASGAVVFAGLPQNSQVSLDVDDDRYAALQMPSMADGGIKLGSTAKSDGGQIKLEPAGSISGRVIVSETGAPQAGVRLYAQSTGDVGSTRFANAVSQADGEYTLKRLGSGTYQVTAQLDGQLAGQYAAQPPASLTVGMGEHHTGKDLLLVAGAIVQGKVVVQGTGQPVPNVPISVSTMPDPTSSIMPIRVSSLAMTSPDGVYTVHALPGRVQVSVSGGGRSMEGLRPPQTPSKTLTLADGATAVADFEFRADTNPPLKGRVTDSDGKPVAGASVVLETGEGPTSALRLMAGNPGPGDATTDADGRFSIAHVANGTILRARKGKMATAQSTVINSSNRDLSIVLLNDAFGSALVHVTGEDGKPIPDAQVMLMIPFGGRRGGGVSTNSGTTDKDGTRFLSNLAPDINGSVRVTARGYGSGSADLKIQPGKQIDLPPIKLAKATSFVAGMVTDETGLPVTDQEVRIQAQQTGSQSVKTDIMGRFRADGIVAGDTVTVYTMIRTAMGGTSGEPQRVPAGTDNLILINKPYEPPTSRPMPPRGGGR